MIIIYDIIKKLTSVEKFVICLLTIKGISFKGKPKNYKNLSRVKEFLPPNVQQYYSKIVGNLHSNGILWMGRKGNDVVIALTEFGREVGEELMKSGECKKVYEIYGKKFREFEGRILKRG